MRSLEGYAQTDTLDQTAPKSEFFIPKVDTTGGEVRYSFTRKQFVAMVDKMNKADIYHDRIQDLEKHIENDSLIFIEKDSIIIARNMDIENYKRENKKCRGCKNRKFVGRILEDGLSFLAGIFVRSKFKD